MNAWHQTALLLPDLTCVVTCAVATAIDLRSQRIPNALTLSSLAVGLLLNTFLPVLCPGGGEGMSLVSAVLGAVVMAGPFALLGSFGVVGMGDVKLMAAVGALLRWPLALPALVFVILAGGLVAFGYAMARGWLLAVLRNLFAMGRRLVRPAGPRPAVELHRIPYALAILLGSSCAVALKYLPMLLSR